MTYSNESISSIDYINSLAFEYIETYSFQRGEEYEQDLKRLDSEYNILKTKKHAEVYLTPIEEARLLELNTLLGFIQKLVNHQGRFHPSSIKISHFERDSLMVEKLISILNTEIIEIPRWLCAPNYRDAVVFYNKSGEIVTVLNVCLSCQYMEIENGVLVNGDYETYDLLKGFFLEVGHRVEDPNEFVGDFIKQLKEKQQKVKKRSDGCCNYCIAVLRLF